MKASELLEKYEEYLAERFKKWGNYINPATAFLRKYKQGSIITGLENEIMLSGDSKASSLAIFLTFISEYGLSNKPIENDLEQVRAKAYELIQEYYKGEQKNSIYISPLNQLLKSIEKGEIEKFIRTNPKFNQTLAVGFLTWVIHSNYVDKVGLTKEQIQYWIDELIMLTMANHKTPKQGEFESVVNSINMLELPYLDRVIVDLVINHNVFVKDLLKITGRELREIGDKTGSEAIANFFKNEAPLPKRAAFPNISKGQVEKIIFRAFTAIGKPEMTLLEWRKLRSKERVLTSS